MEIIQTIWTALTTQNEALTTALCIPLTFLEGIVSMLLFTTILNIKSDKRQKFFYVIFVSVIGLIGRFAIPAPYNAFFNIIAMILSVKFIFNTTVLKSVLGILIPFLLVAILESIISKVYYSIFKIDYIIGMNIPFNRLCVTLIIYFIVLNIYLIVKYLKLSFPNIEVLNKKQRISLILTIIFGIILIATQLYTVFFYADVLPFFIILLNIFSLVAYFFISMYTIFTVAKLQSTSINLEEAKLYNKTLQILHDNIRAFKHDFWNIVQGIGGYIGKGDIEGLKKYYEKLVEDCQQVNNLTALSPEVVNNPAIYNILADKYHNADELGIKINLEVFTDLNDFNINYYQLIRILGILMNNAVEAAKECDEKIINVCFRKDKNRHMHIIYIENTYKDKNINTETIFEKGFSTKEGNTGIGLWEVRQILKKNNNLNLYTTKNNQYFCQQFEIYY
ncbi:MAG: GHKL domain-containing protein [Clostridiaceae bacterium]|nr:GHKL domain-containing protein [Clostridiaceae bacterium]